MPLITAEGIRRSGSKVAAIGLAGQYDPELPHCCDLFRVVGITSLGRWIRTLHGWGVREAVMVGRVSQKRKYARLQFLRYPPDWRAIRLWYRHMRHDRRTGALLAALADELASNGVVLIDSRMHVQDHLATPGTLGRIALSNELRLDVEFGWPLFERVLELGVGQAMAVRGRDVIAVEAAEGTNRMIERAGELCRGRPWVLFKASSRDHDMRADVATVGVETIERLQRAGGRAIAAGSHRVILIDKPDVLAAADRLGVAIVGMG